MNNNKRKNNTKNVDNINKKMLINKNIYKKSNKSSCPVSNKIYFFPTKEIHKQLHGNDNDNDNDNDN